MVGASKILTVSYGTFSCTLEGFDEPFNTMKAIAEYFRDLAADDRYFGAEPPQPDAEMLHRIAEREMSRRVEARIQKNGVVLRPGAADDAPMPAPLAAPAVSPTDKPQATDEQATPVAAPAAAPVSAPVADPVAESVAAKLQRIRAAVARARACAEAETEAEPDELTTGFAQSVSAPPAVDLAADQPVSMPEDFGFELDISGPLSHEENAALSETPASLTEDIGPTDTAEDLWDTEVGASAPPATEAEAESDAETACETETAPHPEQESLEARQRRRAERRAARLAERSAQSALDIDIDSDSLAAAQTDEVTQAQPEPQAPLDAVAETVPEPDAAEGHEPPRPAIRARVIKLRRAEPLPKAVPAPESSPEPIAQPDPQIPAETETMLAALAAQLATGPAQPLTPPQDETGLSPEAEAELMAELAALGADLPDDGWGSLPAEPATTLPAMFADSPDAGAEASAPETQAPETQAPETSAPETSAPETQADFAAVAAAEPEAADAEMDAAEHGEADAPMILAAEARLDDAATDLPHAALRATAPPLPDGDVSRLLDKADAQMAGQESRRRVSAIAHLKAAVAATVAERRANGEPARADDTVPYRQDLTQAVRPRRPVLPTASSRSETATAPEARLATARPELRPAPLVLVSEQRVDRLPAEEAAKAQAVRPRRVTSETLLRDDLDITDDMGDDGSENGGEASTRSPLSPHLATSFAEFAQSRAPQGLAELLEAAAAYTAQIEGRPHFSPPQIMRKVTTMGTETFSREDRLRVFGTLLRQGKIAKVSRGQYAITQASRFYGRIG